MIKVERKLGFGSHHHSGSALRACFRLRGPNNVIDLPSCVLYRMHACLHFLVLGRKFFHISRAPFQYGFSF